MRVFCPEHKRGFFAPRQSPIKCENRGHELGEIDFEGDARTPVEIQWQYCCNCEHFCPADFDQYGLQRCPVCTRKSSLLYLCDRCHVISFESNTPLQTKNFTLTAEGAPQPSCPGCLRPASADLHEHSCEDFNVTFITPLNTCPLCEDRLDLAPAFPSRVADYLKRTKASHKTNVTFDYETGAFVPVEDGEFVIVTSNDQAIIMPRAAKFTNKRDFYEFYQDYYHCANPDAGDVLIIHPAFVTQTENGWTLQATGMLEVFAEQPKKKIVPAPAPTPTPAPPPPPVVKREPPVERIEASDLIDEKPAVQKEEVTDRACPECGSMIEAKYSFCWKCGHSLTDKNKSVSNGRRPGTLLSSALGYDDDELTVQHEAPLNSFSWTDARATAGPTTSSRGSVLKLIAIAGISLLLVSLGLFGLFRSDATTATASVAQPAPVVAQPSPAATITTEVSRNESNQTTTQQIVATPEDELKKLRERGMSAKASERSKIIQAFAKVEKQYPRDYRFPYERAKLAAKGSRSRSEAFKALNSAAEKAIKTGKATEMLSGLETDKSTDFNQLANGRYEWARLVAALKKRDTSLLSE